MSALLQALVWGGLVTGLFYVIGWWRWCKREGEREQKAEMELQEWTRQDREAMARFVEEPK